MNEKLLDGLSEREHLLISHWLRRAARIVTVGSDIDAIIAMANRHLSEATIKSVKGVKR